MPVPVAAAARTAWVAAQAQRRKRGKGPILGGAGGAFVLIVLLIAAAGGGVSSLVGACKPKDQGPVDVGPVTAAAKRDIPARQNSQNIAIGTYKRISDRLDIDWHFVASIGAQECNHGRCKARNQTNSSGCVGPMQLGVGGACGDFFGSYKKDGDGDGKISPTDSEDAVATAINGLKRGKGAPGKGGSYQQYRKAACGYYGKCADGSANYADEVMARAVAYGFRGPGTPHGGVRSQVESNAATAPPPGSEGAGSSAGSDGGGASFDEAGATKAARASGAKTVGFAVADRGGQIVAQHNGGRLVRGASITKAMLLVAYLDSGGQGRRGALAAMIQRSDNAAANTIYHAVGRGAVERVAKRAGMTDFALDVDDPAYALGNSRVTANDQARLFAQIDRLIPARSRSYGMGLLSNLSANDQWGVLDAPVAGDGAPSKAGWKPSSGGGWIVNQAAQVSPGGKRMGLAIVSDGNPSFAAGKKTMQTVATALVGKPQPAAGGGGGCGGGGGGGEVEGLQTVPGRKAKILPNGEAAAPEEAPEPVKRMIAAANRINKFRYSFGGAHGAPAQTMNQTRPNPAAAPGEQENGGPGYDCSSSTSYVIWADPRSRKLLGGQVVVSGALAGLGEAGKGKWVTWFANGGHVYIEVAGIFFDTAGGSGHKPNPPSTGPRWTPDNYGPAGFTQRHPQGL